MGYMDDKASEKGMVEPRAENKERGKGRHSRQETGGAMDDTPGQIRGSVNAKVIMAYPKRVTQDLGGSEHRGRGNVKRSG